MIRHIFIGNFKEGIANETKQKELAYMQAMKEKIPGIVELRIGFSPRWAGSKNQIVMTVDFAFKEDFDVYMAHPYHMDYVNKTGDMYFERSSFVSAQFVF